VSVCCEYSDGTWSPSSKLLLVDLLSQAVLANGDVIKTAARARKSAAGWVLQSEVPPQQLQHVQHAVIFRHEAT
jgi:hypothetical protein